MLKKQQVLITDRQPPTGWSGKVKYADGSTRSRAYINGKWYKDTSQQPVSLMIESFVPEGWYK